MCQSYCGESPHLELRIITAVAVLKGIFWSWKWSLGKMILTLFKLPVNGLMGKISLGF